MGGIWSRIKVPMMVPIQTWAQPEALFWIVVSTEMVIARAPWMA